MDDSVELTDFDFSKSHTVLPVEVIGSEVGEAKDSIPLGYLLEDDGVYLSVPGSMAGEKQADRIWISSHFYVSKAFHDAEGGQWGRLFKVQTPDGTMREVVLFEHEIEASISKARARLAMNGLRISADKEARQHFETLLRSWSPSKISTLAQRPGWVSAAHKSFILGNGVCLGTEDVLADLGPLPVDARASSQCGSIELWRKELASLCQGNPLLMVAVSQAFVGPLLFLNDWPGGGIHLRGQSSTGKTTVMMAANSVWGPVERVQNWRTTDNALEDIARSANDMLLCLDELGQVDARSLDNAAYMLAEGRGKQRAKASGESAGQRSWRVAYISTGEISIGEKLEEANRNAMLGQEVRLIDLSAASYAYGAFDNLHGLVNGAALSKKIATVCRKNFGVAGREFVLRLLENPEKFRTKAEEKAGIIYETLIQHFRQVTNATELRIMRRMAQTAAAGQLATEFGLTGWKEFDVKDAVISVLEVRYQQPGPSTDSDTPAVVLEVRDAIDRHGLGIKRIGVDPSDQTVKPQVIFRDDRNFYIPGSIWKGLFPARDAAVAARILATRGFLLPGDGNNLMKRVPRSINWIGRAYTVPISILESAPADDKAA